MGQVPVKKDPDPTAEAEVGPEVHHRREKNMFKKSRKILMIQEGIEMVSRGDVLGPPRDHQ